MMFTSGRMQRLITFLLLSAALLAGVWAVSPGEAQLQGCEEFYEENEHNQTEFFELLTFNFEEVRIPLTISFWLVIAAFTKMAFHHSPLPAIVPESCILIIVGFIVGGFYQIQTKNELVFQVDLDAKTFFIYLLPPIMMESGYFMPQVAFWNNVGSILVFAVIGTLFNAFTIGLSLWGLSQKGVLNEGVQIDLLENFLFGSLIAAVDPVAVLGVFEEIHVNQVLHILVFGESLLNDGVTVVLYTVFQSFTDIGLGNMSAKDIGLGVLSFFVVALGGTFLGILIGMVAAFCTKFTYRIRLIEPVFVFVMAYLSYIIAEMCSLSAILSCVFCTMFMRPYVEKNISKKSHTTVKYFMKMLASMAESIIFIFLGITTLDFSRHHWNTAFVLFTLLFTVAYRTIGVIIQCWVLNRFRLFKINRRSQTIMSYGGIRGGIAFSLVTVLCGEVVTAKKIFFTATVFIVMFTVFVQGITIKPVVNWLHVVKIDKRKPTMNEEIYERLNEHMITGIEDITGRRGHHYIKERIDYINEHFFIPLLVREPVKVSNETIINVYSKLAEKDALELAKELKISPSMGSFDVLQHSESQSTFSPSGTTSVTLEVPSEHKLRQRHVAEAGAGVDEHIDIEGTHEESPSASMSRNSSFTHIMDMFRQHAFKPHQTHTVRQSRHFLTDTEMEEPQPMIGRSLRILARHKTRKSRKPKGMKGRRQGSSSAHLYKKGGSTASLGKAAKSDGAPKQYYKKTDVPTIEVISETPTKDEDGGITFTVNPLHDHDDENATVGRGAPSVEGSVGGYDPGDVRFAIADEQSDGIGETRF